jgi:hypothetical protein
MLQQGGGLRRFAKIVHVTPQCSGQQNQRRARRPPCSSSQRQTAEHIDCLPYAYAYKQKIAANGSTAPAPGLPTRQPGRCAGIV